MNTGMTSVELLGDERHRALLAKYYVPSMGDYTAPGERLGQILEQLDSTGTVPAGDKAFLRDKGLFRLSEFVDRLEATGFRDFTLLRPGPGSPEWRAEERRLRAKYDVVYEREDAHGMLALLRRLDAGQRLTDADVVWLEERDSFSEPIRRAFHRQEAEFHRTEFERTGDPWAAVSGCSHFRQADLPDEALALVERVPDEGATRLRSAVCTTRGGALRDLRRIEDALASAEAGHRHAPKSFHPCTLLGALYYELGRLAEGDAWFQKALERGAEQGSVDRELRTIFLRSQGEQREALKRHLLSLDSRLYAWVHTAGSAAGRRPRRG